MLSGFLLIAMGILILVEPRILVALLSGFLIASGTLLLILHWRLKKVYRAWGDAQNRFERFIIRF